MGFGAALQSKNLAIKQKLDDRWLGLYQIRKVPLNSTFYRLEEPDGTHLKATFAGNRLKRFFSRAELDEDCAGRHKVIGVRDALEDAKADVPAEGGSEEDLKPVPEILDTIEVASEPSGT